MLLITLKKRDAMQLQSKLQKTDYVVYPANLVVARLLREIMEINQKLYRLSNALLWKKLEYSEYEKLTARFDEALKQLRELNIDAAKMLQAVYPKNTKETKENANDISN